MALPDTAKLVLGTPIVFSDATYSPADAGQPSGQDAALNLTGVLAGGVAHQSAKADLSANMDLSYNIKAYIEFFTAAPTAGGTVDIYVGFSSSSNAGEDNPGGLSGADAVYQGYGADTASGTEALPQLEFVGSLVVANDVALQVAKIGVVVPSGQQMMVVAVNNTDQPLAATNVANTAIVATPVQYQIQD